MRDNSEEFLDDYINCAPLNGIIFITDAVEVHTYLVKFISDNDTAESKVQANATQNNGRQDYLALQDHHEVLGVNSLDVVKTDKTLDSLFYTGGIKPVGGTQIWTWV